MSFPQRKNIRLVHELYVIPGYYFSITICTEKRKPFFTDTSLAQTIFSTIVNGKIDELSELCAFCLMPDHVHLLVSTKKHDIISVIAKWKSYTTHLAKKTYNIGKLWQRSFYDHALRKDEDIETVVRYIINNPVRKELVTDWRKYPYSWSKWDV